LISGEEKSFMHSKYFVYLFIFLSAFSASTILQAVPYESVNPGVQSETVRTTLTEHESRNYVSAGWAVASGVIGIAATITADALFGVALFGAGDGKRLGPILATILPFGVYVASFILGAMALDIREKLSQDPFMRAIEALGITSAALSIIYGTLSIAFGSKQLADDSSWSHYGLFILAGIVLIGQAVPAIYFLSQTYLETAPSRSVDPSALPS
jgi:uncharacterized membrane protein HdeD (DUF308 family)